MSFSFREVTISGLRNDTEGTSQAINEITDVLVNEMGWVLEDDRRTQAGNSDVTLTHKVVFKNDTGESGTDSNWYFTITSGTTASLNQNTLGFQMHSAYDVGTHDTAATGVENPVLHSTLTLATDSNGNFNLWVSGDKDSVVFVTNQINTYGHMTVGKSKGFLDDTIEPFGLYIAGVANTTATSTQVRSIVSNPPIALANANEGEFLSIALTTTNEPRQGLGQDEAIFTFFPMVHMVDDASPVRKGAIGMVRNMWVGVSSNAGWIKESLITISGSSQTYLGFPETTNSLVIRRS